MFHCSFVRKFSTYIVACQYISSQQLTISTSKANHQFDTSYTISKNLFSFSSFHSQLLSFGISNTSNLSISFFFVIIIIYTYKYKIFYRFAGVGNTLYLFPDVGNMVYISTQNLCNMSLWFICIHHKKYLRLYFSYQNNTCTSSSFAINQSFLLCFKCFISSLIVIISYP